MNDELGKTRKKTFLTKLKKNPKSVLDSEYLVSGPIFEPPPQTKVKLCLCLIDCHFMETYGGVEVYLCHS
jgi:hypothetical protein